MHRASGAHHLTDSLCRPAFMAEYAQLEAELKSVYAVYMDRFVNLNYLESEMQQVQFAEQELKLVRGSWPRGLLPH